MYLQQKAPWNLTKPEDTESLHQIIFLCAESLRVCGILLQPFMPSKMGQLLDMLGVADDVRMYHNTDFGSDMTFGEAKQSGGKEQKTVLFPQLSSYF